MDQGPSLGQLYVVHNEIKITTKHWLGLLIYYDILLMLDLGCYSHNLKTRGFMDTIPGIDLMKLFWHEFIFLN
jgi:hypothetical protein